MDCGRFGVTERPTLRAISPDLLLSGAASFRLRHPVSPSPLPFDRPACSLSRAASCIANCAVVSVSSHAPCASLLVSFPTLFPRSLAQVSLGCVLFPVRSLTRVSLSAMFFSSVSSSGLPLGNGQMEVLAFGSESLLCRPCVDCGVKTGRFCDFCYAADNVPSERWAEGQRTPFCSKCDNEHEECHFCRGIAWCTPPTKEQR